MIFLKQYILNDYITDDARMVNPMMEINGFKVRPGFFDLNGASEFSCGVNFTVHTSNGTSCDLLLFHPGEEEPYAIIPFPESYKIGDVYSMIVYDLKSEDFEYAYCLIKQKFCWIHMLRLLQDRKSGDIKEPERIMQEL